MNAGADEQQSTRGDQRPTVVFAARVPGAARRQFGELAERNTPAVLARGEVNGVQRSPGRGDGGVALGVEPASISREPERLVDRRGVGFTRGDVLAFEKVLRHRAQGLALDIGEGGHTAAALAQKFGELRLRHPLTETNERRKLRWRSLQAVAVAGRAIAQVDGFASAATDVVRRE